LTLLLTIIAQKLALAESVPKLAYITMMDWFMIINIFLIIAIVVANGLVSYFLFKITSEVDTEEEIEHFREIE